MSPDPESAARADTRTRVVEVAATLLRDGGPAAVTTRAVAGAAGVQAPTIYRIFGDKDGLLEAVAEHVMASFVAAKSAVVEAATAEGLDPLEDLDRGWRSQIEFGLANPALFRLLGDPDRVVGSPSAESGRRVLAARVHRLAAVGRLRVSEPRAVGLIQAAGTGVIQTLLSTPPAHRDPGLADDVWTTVLDRILTEPAQPARSPHATSTTTVTAAVTMRAVVGDLEVLSDAERRLFAEWLDRVVAGSTPDEPARST